MSSQKDKEKQSRLQASGIIPQHIAIIMDGNGRWAKKKNLPRYAGHRIGIDSVRDIVEASAQIGVRYLTLYTFSTENWKRPKEEVSTLMRLLVRSLKKEIRELHKNNVRLTTIGNTSAMPETVQKELEEAKEKTAGNTGLVLVLALSYSGRWEITEAVRKIAIQVQAGDLKPEEINDAVFSTSLATAGIPDPDLLIRTSGEIRVSNFLLWQIAYSEIYISDVYWPDFRRDALYEAVASFQKRERRFGKVSEQIAKNPKGMDNAVVPSN